MKVCVGIDIGGSYIKGVVISGQEVKYKLTKETHDNRKEWQREVAGMLDILKNKSGTLIESVGLSAPGITDSGNRTINFMPGRLQGLEHFDWSGFLESNVHVLNDAHAALLSESRWGVAKDVANVIMLTLGTGIGGGLLLNGQLHQGFLHRAGHLGHISVDASNESRGITGISGSLEDAVGEATLAQRSIGKFTNTFDLVKAYKAGDTWATYVWLTSVRKLALSISSFCNAFSPELVVLAGGMVKAGKHLLEPLSCFMDLYEWRPGGQATPVKLAEFQEYAGAIGAALFAHSRSVTT